MVSQQLNSHIQRANLGLVWLKSAEEKGSYLAEISKLGRTGIEGLIKSDVLDSRS